MNAQKPQPIIPPDDSMWQKYSSHFEFPLASATSIFLHGLVIGVLAIGGLAFFFAANAEATKPPNMDVVMVEGEGSGFEGMSGFPGLPGSPDNVPARTELVPSLPDQPPPAPDYPPLPSKDDPVPQLGLPLIDDGKAPASNDLVIELQKIAEAAEKRAKELTPSGPPLSVPGPKEGKKVGLVGTGNPKGTGGLGGPGSGPGLGKKFGPGTGSGRPGGRPVTKQEIYALRWSFDLSGDGAEHARKLAAMGVTVGIIDAKGSFYYVTDLNRRPAELKRDKMPNLQEIVGWQNRKADSIQALARELKLPLVPQAVVLMLPKDREEKMAAEEARFAAEQGRALNTVRRTWFDFRLRNGVYDPVGIRFE